MEKLTRQQKRKRQRDWSKNRWYVQNWQTMKFSERQTDLAGLTETIDIYINDLYLCVVREYQECTHLSIKKHDKSPVHNWQHLQQIKNDICGNEREAIELYPAMSRIIDTCNQYHLWVLRERLSIGFHGRAVQLN